MAAPLQGMLVEVLVESGDQVMAVPVEMGETFSAGIPVPLFKLANMNRARHSRSLSVSNDGRYRAVLPPEDWQPTGRLHLVLDWLSTLPGS